MSNVFIEFCSKVSCGVMSLNDILIHMQIIFHQEFLIFLSRVSVTVMLEACIASDEHDHGVCHKFVNKSRFEQKIHSSLHLCI